MRATRGEGRDLVPFVEDVNLPDRALARVHRSGLWEVTPCFVAIEPLGSHEMGPIH